jgi:hypothetical protein
MDSVALVLKDTMEELGGALLKIVPVEAEVVIADMKCRSIENVF